MPIYTYECPQCSDRVEMLQPLNAALPPICAIDHFEHAVVMRKVPSVPARPHEVYSFHHPGGTVHMKKQGFNVAVSGKRM